MITLASGIGLTEGPLWTSDGRLLVVSVSRGHVFEVGLDGGGARPIAETGGAPSGLAEDAGGAVWIAQGGSHLRTGEAAYVPGGVQRLTGDRVAMIASYGLHAPNDCVVGPGGRLWFTDPRGPALHGTPEPGRVWSLCLGEDGPVLAAEGVFFPNGLAFAPDPSVLYVAETATRRLLRYSCRDGELGPAHTLAELTDGHPDGMAVDADGNILVAGTTAGAVIVLDPGGTEIERVDVGAGSMPTNVCFGGPDLATLFVTAAKGGRVLALERETPGLPLPAFRAPTTP